MDLGWGNQKANKWVTNVGLITTDGPDGQDIMAAEWTYYVSYSPALISVHIGGSIKGEKKKATFENILSTQEFGVSIAASDQNVLSSIAGKGSGRDVDKIAVLREMGVEFYPAKQIKVRMVKGAATNAECKVKEMLDVGDHVMVIGEVLEIESDQSKIPLIYSGNKYWAMGAQIGKPQQETLDKIDALLKKYSKV